MKTKTINNENHTEGTRLLRVAQTVFSLLQIWDGIIKFPHQIHHEISLMTSDLSMGVSCLQFRPAKDFKKFDGKKYVMFYIPQMTSQQSSKISSE